MFRADDAETSAETIKKFFILFLVFLLSAGCFTFVPVRRSDADKNSPPDESITESQPSVDATNAAAAERAKREKEEAARREQRRKAEAARKAREKAKRDAKEAAEAKRREAEEMARAASEDMINRTLTVSRNLVENGRFQSAINVMTGFLDANPHSADGWYLISRAHHALGDYDRAQIAVNIALEIDPYYADLVKTPSGLEPRPYLTKQQKKEPRPSMSVLPVKPPLPANLLLEPVVISFPFLVEAERTGRGEPAGSDPITGAYLQYAPYPPEPLGATVAWMQSERWNEISRWRFRVDRMGILMEPRVPIAWRGSHPYEAYFWTGDEWARVRRKDSRPGGKATYDDILYGAQESIAEVLHDRGFVWNEADTPSLAASASLMRYMWMGSVDLMDAAARAEKSARERRAPADAKRAENQ